MPFRLQADDWVMSMCFRMCLCNRPNNSVPITMPAGYVQTTMELLRRQIISDAKRGVEITMDTQFLIREVGDGKIDLNSGAFSKSPFSTDLPFLQHDWPRVRQLRHNFGPLLTCFPALCHPTRVVCHALLRNHACWTLIGACDPML